MAHWSKLLPLIWPKWAGRRPNKHAQHIGLPPHIALHEREAFDSGHVAFGAFDGVLTDAKINRQFVLRFAVLRRPAPLWFSRTLRRNFRRALHVFN